MGYHEHKHHDLKNVICAVVTISDSRTEVDDSSGQMIKQRLIDNGHQVNWYKIIKDDNETISAVVDELLGEDEIQVIITNGGTGVSHWDVTVETIYPMLGKKLDGFGELFRSLTFQEIGSGSIMSRAIGGVTMGKVVLCLPGSPDAVNLAMDKIILPEIGHLVREATR